MRLEGGHGLREGLEGRVIVTRGGVTGTICGDNFDNNDAKVVCKMLDLRLFTCILKKYKFRINSAFDRYLFFHFQKYMLY